MYKVKFWNPANNKGFIEGYKTAAKAKEVVAKFNELRDNIVLGVKAEYLGKEK